MSRTFPGLDPSNVAVISPVSSAQRYLATAYDSVSSLIEDTYPLVRAQREASRGRLKHAEQDLFRAAVVFAGAGVDAVLKQALRSCVPIQLERSVPARDRYLEFVEYHIRDGQEISTKRIARLLISADHVTALREAYVQDLTGSSLQSQKQVTASLAALGFDNSDHRELFKASSLLNPLFKARNEIAHELDMTPAARSRQQGARTRRERAITSYVSLCHDGLNYCQRVLNLLEAEIA